jgi:predicted permease
MDLFKALSPVIPVFMLIACGFAFAHWKRISLTSVTKLIVYLGTPALVFQFPRGQTALRRGHCGLVRGILIIFAIVGLLIRLYFFIFQFSSRGFALPCLFMNAGVTFVLTEKYRQDPGLAASIVVISTS